MIATGTCSARAALAGNPSDGYRGAVVSVPVNSVSAVVTATSADRFEIVHSPTADDTFATLDRLVDHIDRFGTDDARQLVLATIRALARHHDVDIDPLRIDVHSDIPRSVGLAGSSAIVIATLRALIAASSGAPWAVSLADDHDALARLALSVETVELGIGAGLQDRLVQAHGAPLLMDFADGAAQLSRRLLEVPGHLVVAFHAQAGEPSGVVHADLRDRYDADEDGVRANLAEIAEQAHLAAQAIAAGDASGLGRAMDRTLDRRAVLLALDPKLLAAAHAVRAAGGHANWTGSGGALIVLAHDAAMDRAIRRMLVDDHRCGLLDL